MQDIASTIKTFMRMASPTESGGAISNEQVTIINADIVHLGTANRKTYSGAGVQSADRRKIHKLVHDIQSMAEQQHEPIRASEVWNRLNSAIGVDSINDMTCEQGHQAVAYLRSWQRNLRSKSNIVDYVDSLNQQQLQFLKDYVNSL